MAYTITKVINHPRAIPGSMKEFLCTSVDDIAKLPRFKVSGTMEGVADVDNDPCDYGSTAMVCDGTSTSVYILTPDNNWTKM